MDAILQSIGDFFKGIFQGWVEMNLTTMFTDVNEQVGMIAGEVAKTPSTWNPAVFRLVDSLSDTVIVPIAGIIITFVLCYELIHMVIDKNNMHEFDTSLFFRYLFKACIAVLLVTQTSNIVMAIFDVGNYISTQAGSLITGSTSINLETELQALFENRLSEMGVGELIGLGFETAIVSNCMKIMSMLITVVLYGRMIEIYLYVSVAPVPMATFTNSEWGSIGKNYLKGVLALAFQGFFIMVCVAIYSVIVHSIMYANNIHSAIWAVAAYTVMLCFALFKTGQISKSILNAQ